jgi:hypothetical protein
LLILSYPDGPAERRLLTQDRGTWLTAQEGGPTVRHRPGVTTDGDNQVEMSWTLIG